MNKIKSALVLLLIILFTFSLPIAAAYADTSYSTELVINGGAELDAITGWTDNTGQSRWNSGTAFSDWALPTAGSKYFYLYNPSMDTPLSGTMSQSISLSGTEGSGLFASIAAGNVALHLSVDMYQASATDSDVKAIVEEYDASNNLLHTSQVVNTTAGTGVMGSYVINTQLQTGTRKFIVILSATLAKGVYAQYDQVSLTLVEAASGSPPVFGSDFPTSATTDSGVAYNTSFTISDPDAGDVDIVTLGASSTNVNLIPAANITFGGSGGNRTMTVTPAGNLSGEADITVTASDGTKSAEKTFHIIVTKVISMDTNLVENGNGTNGLASWEGNTVNITATGDGFKSLDPQAYMSQNVDVSKFSSLINGGETYFLLSAELSSTIGRVTVRFYTDIACTNAVGSSYYVNGNPGSSQQKIPAGTLGVKVTFSGGSYSGLIVKNISFKVIDDFPKIKAIEEQSSDFNELTVDVHAYYTTESATLTAVSSNQSIVANSGITVSGTGFDRTVAFTPLTNGTVTITLTLNDGSETTTASFNVIVRDPTKITSLDAPASGYYGAGSSLDFTIHFSRSVTGGASSLLPLTVGSVSVNAAYYSATTDSITYRYTLASDDTGSITIGSALTDSSASITDADGFAPELAISASSPGITAVPLPEIISSASSNTATYGTQVTFTATLDCADTLSGTVQFKADGVNLGSPVTLSSNQAQYETGEKMLTAGSPSITAEYIPSGTTYRFTSLTSSTCDMTIEQKSVSVSGLAATNRTYNGTTDVALTGGTLNGVLDGDTVSATCPTAGTAAQKNAGTQAVTFTAITLTGTDKDNYVLSAQPIISVVIAQKSISVTADASNKEYDGAANATVTNIIFSGLITGESFTADVDYTASGLFDRSDVESNIPVTLTLSLKDTVTANNYTLSSGTLYTTASIAPKTVSVTGLAATSRAYNGTTDVELSGGVLTGIVDGETVSATYPTTGTAAQKNAGTHSVSFAAITLTGEDKDHYILSSQPSVSVVITQKAISFSATVSSKTYDGTTSATITGIEYTGLVSGETLTTGVDCTVSAAFERATVGNDIPVTITMALSDTVVANNYTLSSSTAGTTANITQNAITISGVAAVNRVYNGTVSVTLTGGTLSGVDPADAADVSFTLGTGSMANANIGTAKPVATSITLTGSKADNYSLSQPSNLTVNISQAPLTLLSATASNKIYDGTTTAVVTGITFSGLADGETLAAGLDYTASGVFLTADAGNGIAVTVSAVLADTVKAQNYYVTGTVGTTANISRQTIYGSVSIDVVNGTGSASLIDQGDQLTANTGGVLAIGTPTISYQWYRNSLSLTGETTSVHIVGDLTTDPVGTSFTVAITGTGNYMGTLTSAAVTIASSPLSGSIAISGVPSLGNTMALDASALAPGEATYTIHWLRDGTDIAGATSASYVIQSADQGTTLKVSITAYGYYTGTKEAIISVPLKSPYIPEPGIVELADSITVDLTLDSTILSADQLARLIALNAEKPIVFSGSDYTLTFPQGCMSGAGYDLDMGLSRDSGTYYITIQTKAGDSLVTMLEFNHSGALPGTMQLSLFVGKSYAGQTMQYLYYNTDTKNLELIQTAVVSQSGYLTVCQDHCSDYAVTLSPATVPITGDSSATLIWWLLAILSAAGITILLNRILRKGSGCKP